MTPFSYAEDEEPSWYFSQFLWENDDIFPKPTSEPGDRFYTNGMRFTWSKYLGSDDGKAFDNLPSWAKWTAKRICPTKDKECEFSAAFSIGQNFYTPEEILLSAPQPDDRPWAGWLYTGWMLGISKSELSRHDFDLQIGVTGPASLAEQVQTEWHQLIDTGVPRGWDNQFDNEVGVNLFYDYQRIFRPTVPPPIEYDFVPNFRLAGGTLMTNIAAGGVARIGKNISGFPFKRIESVLSNRLDNISTSSWPQQHDSYRDKADWEFYLFAGAYGKAVVHNYFLEGSLFRNDSGVKSESYVWEVLYGFSVRRMAWRLTYTISRRGPEFERGVGTDNGIHNFASLFLTREIH